METTTTKPKIEPKPTHPTNRESTEDTTPHTYAQDQQKQYSKTKTNSKNYTNNINTTTDDLRITK